MAAVLLACAACGRSAPTAVSHPGATAPPATSASGSMGVLQRVSSLGLQVDVPASWPVNAWSGCGRPPVAQIERGQGIVAGCASGRVLRSLLRIVPDETARANTGAAASGRPSPSPSGSAVRLSGVPALVTRERTPDGRFRATVAVAQRDVRMVVESPEQSVVDRAVASARLVRVDDVGCATELGAAPNWDRPRAGPPIQLAAKAQPTSVAVCDYQRLNDRYVLAASFELTGPAATRAVAALDHARAGALPSVPTSQCTREPESDPLWLQVRYASAPPVPVHVLYSTCDARAVITPAGVSQVTQGQLAALLTPLHTGYGYAAPLPAR